MGLRRRKLKAAGYFIASLVVVIGLVGCGAGSTSSGTSGTPAGIDSVTVTTLAGGSSGQTAALIITITQ